MNEITADIPDTPDQPLLVDIRRAAFFLGLSWQTGLKLIDSGALPVVRISEKRMVRMTDLRRFVAELPTLTAKAR